MTAVEIAVTVVAVAAALSGIIIFVLFYIGLMNGYHPLKKPKEDQIRVACVGDSITYGCMVKNRNKNNYPNVLNGLLGEGYCVNNFGYTDRAVIYDADLPYVKEKLYKQSLDFKPDIVVFLLGSNDTKKRNWNKEKFIQSYNKILDGYLSLESKPKLYVLIPPPMFEVGGKVKYGLRNEVLDEICPLVKAIADKRGLETIDLYEAFKGKKELFSDGVHPNAKGSKVLAQTVYERIKNDTEVYVYRFPFEIADDNILPKEREEEINSVSNPDVKRQKFYVWKLLEQALSQTYGVKIDSLKFENIDGKWSCNGCEFSLSHKGNIVAVALSKKPVGIDVEEIAPERFTDKLIDKITTESEKDKLLSLQGEERGREACRLWTVKEACYKKDGGKNFLFANTDVSEIPQRTITVACEDNEYFVTVVSPDDQNVKYHFQNLTLKED